MTTAAPLGGVRFFSDHNPIPGMLFRPLAASEQVGKGQFVSVSQSTGYAVLQPATTLPYRVAAGLGDYSELSDTSATDALAAVRLSQRFFTGLAMGSSTDGFTDADFCVPFWIKDGNTLGKLSHSSADATLVNRTLGGLVFGLDKMYSTNLPVGWTGPVAWAVARGVLMAEASVVASAQFTCSANTTHTESVLARRNACHGQVVEVRVTCDNGFTASDTQYWTILVQKRTSTTPGTPITVATATLQTSPTGLGSITAFKYVDVTLGTGTVLDVLEDDVFTVTVTTAGTSAALTNFTVEVIAKVK